MATFANCEITGQLGNYTLSASATGLTSATSTTFAITVGSPSKLAFTTQPGGGVDGLAWTTQPSVAVEDAGGNIITTATNSITLVTGTNAGSVLGCATNPLLANSGVAGFAGCQITGTTGPYTLTATAGGLTNATSTSFNITIGAAVKLAFTTQPGGGANGASWGTQPTVAVEDVGGNVVTTATNSITLAIGTNPGGTLACTANPKAATGGSAGFAGCAITGTAGSYTLTASATGLTTATSSAFNITAGTATKLVYTTQPGGGADGPPWGAQPTVAVEDASGNVVTTATNSITLAIGTNPGGTLACTANPKAATGGAAHFAGCQITGTAGSYTVTASATGLTTATSSASNITAGTATSSSTPPSPVAEPTRRRGAPSPPSPSRTSAATRDDGHQLASPWPSGPTRAARWPAPPTPRPPPVARLTFAGCAITGTAGSYTLTASATGLATATSSAFNITAGTATKLAYTTQPGGGANGCRGRPSPPSPSRTSRATS